MFILHLFEDGLGYNFNLDGAPAAGSLAYIAVFGAFKAGGASVASIVRIAVLAVQGVSSFLLPSPCDFQFIKIRSCLQ